MYTCRHRSTGPCTPCQTEPGGIHHHSHKARWHGLGGTAVAQTVLDALWLDAVRTQVLEEVAR